MASLAGAAQQTADGFGAGSESSADGFGTAARQQPSTPDLGTEETDRAQAQEPDQDAPQGAGRQRGGLGFPGGQAAGTEGVVTGLGELGITVASAAGESLQFIIDESTGFSSETTTDVAALANGDIVSIRFATPTVVDGQAVEPDGVVDVAIQVTILPAGSEVGQGAGRGQRAGGQGQGGQRGEGGPGGGGQRGFGRGLVLGSVDAISENALTVTLASGESQEVPFDSTTTFVRQTDADQSLLAVGSDVRVQVQRGGFGQGGDTTEQSLGPSVATLVTLLGATTG